jgi:short subunit dehydrogenase-like uncharacterized protein
MILIYGVTGYTGELVVEEALRRGLRPVIAGRDAAKVAAMGARTGLETRVFSVEMPDLTGVRVLLNIAGPFTRTAGPLVDACVRAGVHYLDVTGEIAVFEALAARDAEARAAGVLLLPGVGFDVVPSDCLAAWLASRLPTANTLTLAIRFSGAASHGTATTAVAGLGGPGAVRRAGKVIPVPLAHATREVDFGRGPKPVVAIPWGDVSTAFYTTGIPNIEVYSAFPAAAIRGMVIARYLGPILRMGVVGRAVQAWVDRQPAGPTPEQRAAGSTQVWGEVVDPAGTVVTGMVSTPEGYTLTALTAVDAAVRVLAGVGHTGFGTPAKVFGADFILGFPGVLRS